MAATGRMEFRLHRGLAGLDELEPAWLALLDELGDAACFHQRPEWHRAYLQALATQPDRVFLVAAFRDQQLLAVCPLEYHALPGMAWLRPRVLGTINHDEMQVADFVCAPGEHEGLLLADLFHWLGRQRELGWDALRLRKVADGSVIQRAALVRSPASTQVLRHDGSAWFDTSGDYEQATRPISGDFKRNLRRLAKRAEGSAPLRHECVSDPDLLAQALAHFVDIEASGWKGSAGQGTAIACQPEMLRFFQELAKGFGRAARCQINLLWHGDLAVAGQFCLRAGRTLNVLKVGYRQSHANMAPGNLLLERMLRDCCALPEVDRLSLVNDPPWARNFKPEVNPVRSYFTPRRSLRGMLLLAALLFKRARDRRVGTAHGTAGNPV